MMRRVSPPRMSAWPWGCVTVIATVFGAVPLAVGVAAHEGSTVVVCLNSLRLRFGRHA